MIAMSSQMFAQLVSICNDKADFRMVSMVCTQVCLY